VAVTSTRCRLLSGGLNGVTMSPGDGMAACVNVLRAKAEHCCGVYLHGCL
jgi:hypothetical protein